MLERIIINNTEIPLNLKWEKVGNDFCARTDNHTATIKELNSLCELIITNRATWGCQHFNLANREIAMALAEILCFK